MVYDLINETPEVLPHFKGGEGEFIAAIHFDGLNKILRGTLPPGATIGRHTHEDDSEIIYILSGHGTVDDDGTPVRSSRETAPTVQRDTRTA